MAKNKLRDMASVSVVSRDGGRDGSLSGDPRVREAMQKMQVKTVIIPGTLLSKPRPGKSLADLSGETTIGLIKLWFEERVGLPKLFDWLISLTSMVLGISMYLYSNQLDILQVGRLSMWMNPIKIALILGGFGLVLSAMIRDELGRQVNMMNYFRGILLVTYFGLSGILFVNGDVEGAWIHGLFGLAILVEALTEVKTSTIYLLYIFGLFVGLYWSTVSSGLTEKIVAASVIESFLGGWSWTVSVAVLVLLGVGVYGYLWNVEVLRKVAGVYGLILCILASIYGVKGFWTRSFVLLLTGMVGLILPYWESFKDRAEQDRTMVFRMFGMVLMSFALCVLVIAAVQNSLVDSTYRILSDKAEYARVEYQEMTDAMTRSFGELVKNEVFVTALTRNDRKTLVDHLRMVSLISTHISSARIVNLKGEMMVSYPSQVDAEPVLYTTQRFFKEVVNNGRVYVSTDLESFDGKQRKDILVATPVVNQKNIMTGVLVVSLSGESISTEMQRIGYKTVGQEVLAISADERYVVQADYKKLGQRIPEADINDEIRKTKAVRGEGYNAEGVHVLVGAAKMTKNGLYFSVSQPLAKVIDISSSWLVRVLFLQLLIGLMVFASYIFSVKVKVKNTGKNGE